MEVENSASCVSACQEESSVQIDNALGSLIAKPCLDEDRVGGKFLEHADTAAYALRALL